MAARKSRVNRVKRTLAQAKRGRRKKTRPLTGAKRKLTKARQKGQRKKVTDLRKREAKQRKSGNLKGVVKTKAERKRRSRKLVTFKNKLAGRTRTGTKATPKRPTAIQAKRTAKVRASINTRRNARRATRRRR